MPAPATGWITGTYDGKPLRLTWQHRSQQMDGQADGRPVHLQTHGDQVTGDDGGAVSLSVQWAPDRFDAHGTAPAGDVDLHFDWTAGSGQGEVGGQPVQMSFEEGDMEGTAFGGSVDVRYDPTSGHMQGRLGGKPLDATLTNLDETDFLQHLYLFAPGA
ncbi:MAG TPA: hypothetical protein VGO93_21715 [Candidatus Xenobia bacterium]|jgi:hypothetical protein